MRDGIEDAIDELEVDTGGVVDVRGDRGGSARANAIDEIVAGATEVMLGVGAAMGRSPQAMKAPIKSVALPSAGGAGETEKPGEGAGGLIGREVVLDFGKIGVVNDDGVDFPNLEPDPATLALPGDMQDVAIDMILGAGRVVERATAEADSVIIDVAENHNSFPYYPASLAGVRSDVALQNFLGGLAT